MLNVWLYSNTVTTVIDYKSSLLGFITFRKASIASKSTSGSGGPLMVRS